MSEDFLSVKDLNVIYTSGKQIVRAVNGVSFDLKQGETLAIVGETGAGKTTIARAILGILPNPPAKLVGGEIWFCGQDLAKAREEDMLKIRGDKISMIFQDPMTALNPLQTVGDQIAEGILLHNEKMSKHDAFKKAQKMLETVGIPASRATEYPFEFSGGMKQRVVIAMAIACKPALLLADEPTTALDVTIQAQVLELIQDLKVKFNTAMILITHDLGVVAETSDNVAVVYAGEIIEYGSKEAIFVHTTHPYTEGLFNSLPDINVDTDRLSPIAGSMPDPTNLPDGCKFSPRCPFATEECRSGQVPLSEIAPGHFCRCLHRQTELTSKERGRTDDGRE